MIKDYVALIERVSHHPIFQGLETEVEKLRVLVNDLRLGTQYNYLATFKKYVEFAKSENADPLKFDLVLVKRFLSRYKATTRSGVAFRLRKILEWNGEIANFKVKVEDNPLPEVLSEEEISEILRVTESLKWRTIFRVTYDGALREHEILGLKIKHVRIDKFGAEIFVASTKSESLWLRLIDSAPLLQEWLNYHPNNKDREAWVFLGRFKDRPINPGSYYQRLKCIAKKAGVKKRVFPHLLRHSRLAWLKKHGAKIGISDSVICKMYGRWGLRNAHRMLDRYGRIEPTEANELILKAHGKLKREQLGEHLGKPRKCPRCHKDNDSLAITCQFCGMVLDEKEAVRLMEESQELSLLKGELLELKRNVKRMMEQQK